MQHLKFRAWHEVHGWCYFVFEPTEENKGHTISFSSVIGMQLMREGLTNWGQCTGLHDKNGKEICSGDILSEQDGIGVVRHLFGGMVATQQLTGDAVINMLSFHKLCEVIGNIYQNPELLN